MITAIKNNKTDISMTARHFTMSRGSTQDFVYRAMNIQAAADRKRAAEKANSLILKDKAGNLIKEWIYDTKNKLVSKTNHTYIGGRHEYKTVKNDGTVIEFFS